MIKIRDFAEIAQVSTSTLRYYDEIGIFKPMRVDPETGYRFYSIEQLLRLNRILALKDLGLDLAQIVPFLDEEEISIEALQGMLRLRQARLLQHIQTKQEQLARVEARLKYIELKGRKLAHEVVLKAVRSLIVIASYTHANDFFSNRAYANTLLALLTQNAVRSSGPAFFLYHESLSEAIDFEIEFAVPVESVSIGNLKTGMGVSEQLVVRELAGVSKMASLIYHGSPHAIVEAYQTLGTWIQTNGYTITGPCRKVCLRWSGEFSEYITEIQFPVELVSDL